MHPRGIGINADASKIEGNFKRLAQELDYYQSIGFDHVEISPHGCGVLYNGILHEARMKQLVDILKCYPFSYTVHAANPMNLMSIDSAILHEQMFRSTIEFTHLVGSTVMVYHAGRYLPEEEFGLPRRKVPEPHLEKALWQQEIKVLKSLSFIAGQYGISIAVENARPYLDAPFYCYAEHLETLGTTIAAIGLSNVGIALDVGHAYLAANRYQYDLLEGVRRIAPLVSHIHLHDNFGKCCASYEKRQYELAATGRGDLHLPVGWGTVPIEEILELIPGYTGYITLEMRPRYQSYYAESLAVTRSMVSIAKNVKHVV